MSVECPHGLEDPQWCSICKHGPEKKKREEAVARFAARYEGHCAICDLPLYVGQRAAKTTRDRVVHEDCL